MSSERILSDYSRIFDVDCLNRLSIPEVMSVGILCIRALVRILHLSVSRWSEFGGLVDVTDFVGILEKGFRVG